MQSGEHTKCLDLFQVASYPGTGKPFCDCAILLEVAGTRAGFCQTNFAIPEGTVISAFDPSEEESRRKSFRANGMILDSW